MLIESLNDVRAGDILISGQNTAPNKVLVYAGQWLMDQQFRIGEFAAGHAAVVTPGGKLVEAMPNGARERDLRETDWSPAHWYFRLPEDYPSQALDAATFARAMIDTPYSFASYAYIGAYLGGFQPEWLADRIDRRRQVKVFGLSRDWLTERATWGLYNIPLEAICSVLAEQAWTLAGKNVVHGTRPQVVTPGMLASQLCFREGVIRGGAGLLG
jgi:hypothetical protein